MDRHIEEELRMPAWLRETIIRIGLLFFGFIIAVLLLEIALRLYWPYSDRFIESNELFGWRLIPNQTGWSKKEGGKIFLQINSKGLRDREYPYEKKKNIFRILVLGDSYCEAAQVSVENAFHKRLESLLNQRSNATKYEVINSGVSGYGTDNELLFYKHEGYKYQSDLVILAFTVGNDISDNFQGLAVESVKPYFVLTEAGPELKNFPVKRKQSLLQRVKDLVKPHSKLYRFLYVTFRERVPAFGNILNKLGFMNSNPRRVMQKGIVRTYLVFHSDYTPAWQEAVEVTKALILQLKKEVEANGSRLMVVLIPKAEQVHENGWVETLEEYPEMKKKTWDLEKPNRLLTKFLDQNNIKILDLLPPMRRLAKTERNMFYIGNRGHWNAEGHRLAAQLLYDYLINHKHVLIED